MNRKTIILCISILAVLALAVVGAVVSLYSESDDVQELTTEEVCHKASERHPLLNAVPSDAAMVLCSETLRGGVSCMMDSTGLFGTFFSGTGKSSLKPFFSKVSSMLKEGELNSIKNSEMVLSVHYSGDLVPLIIIDPGRVPSDSTGAVWRLIAEADSSSVCHAFLSDTEKDSPLGRRTLLALSASETLVKSAERHVRSRISVLEDEDCAAAAASLDGSLSMLVNHSYSGKLALSFLARNFSIKSGFIKSFAEWTSFRLSTDSEKRLTLEGDAFSTSSTKFFSNMLGSVVAGPTTAANILPNGTLDASVLAIDNVESFIQEYNKYLDASGKLDKRNSAAAALGKKYGITPAQWAKRLNIKEVCAASVPVGDKFANIVMVRPTNQDAAASEMPVAEYAPLLFGDIFTVQDTARVVTDGWIITGDALAVKSFTPSKGRRTLSSFLSDNGASGLIPGDGALFYNYYSPSADPSTLTNIFKPAVVGSATRMMEGLSHLPVVFSLNPGKSHLMKLDIAKIKFAGSKDEVPALSRDTVVVIPKGPFKVKNCGTGKMNLFSQQTNNYLVLKELDGKGIWGVPFSAPICGAVAQIDYFANGKIQFLFASGSSLYLIDRLGRFVKPFPVDLGKPILIGPDAYDFTGAHGYTAVVLHNDNTIGMYDLHGKTPASWKGIRPEDTVKALPELIRVKGKRYWAVRTSTKILFYGFDGGKPVFDPQGDKMIRPDSKITVSDDGKVTAVCYDGKERTVKLN